MKKVLMLLSLIGLCLTLIPSYFVFKGSLSWNSHAQLMLAGMVLWFLTAPFWMTDKKGGL